MGNRVILHSDINSCYASIEHLYHPELSGRPLAVGGDPEKRHGIVLTADYIAKKRGVKTGMALWQAKQVCPEITCIPPRMDLYLRFSRMAHEIYGEYTDLQEPYGIDESWLDVTNSCSLKGDGLHIAQEISSRMKKELGITVSVGVSFNKIFAKLGSDYKKPDAVTTMYKSEFRQKAWQLPVSDLLYVGRSTNKKLEGLGIHTIGGLAQMDEKILQSRLGKMGSVLWAFANGYDDSPVKKENTLYSFTRQSKLDNASNITGEIAEAAYKLFRENYHWNKPVRSVGVRGADLVNDNYWEQLDLFCDFRMREKQMKMDIAVDDIRRRFGFYSIQRGLMYRDRMLSSVDAKEDHTVHPHGYFG